ncbi:14053_t:CDS:2 [Funneliformis geosporum]|uniref:14053_t:CDS:1 n=1 Tax=Funneliformis geosporum TaxID=1117311 RepID=A0A9W4WZH4_9GLOM|nr:14053_t:CDS:2 [Funneliformis geosporum]
MVTLSGLKAKLISCITFPDGTEENNIAINCVLGGGKKRTTMHLLVDEDLLRSNSFIIDLIIDVDTSQQPFSSWTFARIQVIFCLKADSFDDYLNSMGEIANEATHCTLFHKLSMTSYIYEISGCHGKGPVDWAIKVGDTIIMVTEAKRDDINQGIAQNAIQLMSYNNKRKYDEAIYEEVMYGIVSTGESFSDQIFPTDETLLFVCAVFGENRSFPSETVLVIISLFANRI